MDEFDEIARLFRPLTFGAPEALDLLDDAAVLPTGENSALVVTTDTIVEGVHTPMGEAPGLIARKLLRTNLSDLAAKAALPHGWFLNVAWPAHYGAAEREAFAAGLTEDAANFGLKLFGGDTVRTSGPLVATATLVGRARSGRFVPRSGAQPGHVLLVSGTIGDSGLGLRVALGETTAGLPDASAWLLDRYRLPQPRLALGPGLLAYAVACADVSDGLLADAGRIAIASGVGVEIDLEAVPLSRAANSWLCHQPDERTVRIALATAGDDYELVCASAPESQAAFVEAAAQLGVPLTRVGRVVEGSGVRALWRGEPARLEALGYVHR